MCEAGECEAEAELKVGAEPGAPREGEGPGGGFADFGDKLRECK